MNTPLLVSLQFQPQTPIPVGRLLYKNRLVYFEYEPAFIERGLQISPFKLPLKTGVQHSTSPLFEGLFGVFNDSLPDGWGYLLLERHLRQLHQSSQILNPLERLSYVGQSGMGALCYAPEIPLTNEAIAPFSLEATATKIAALLKGEEADIAQLLALNGSSAGVRPKIWIYKDEAGQIESKPFKNATYPSATQWLVKFSGQRDLEESGKLEYAYHLLALKAGMKVPRATLLNDKYFAVERFDRRGDKRLHLISASGLLHADHRAPTLDYDNLLKACLLLTKKREAVKDLYAQAVFNVLAHNKDDHAKNFSFLMDEMGDWTLAPAYDLTFSQSVNNEQAMLVCGEGREITLAHLQKLGMNAGLKPNEYNDIIDKTKTALQHWPMIASTLGLSNALANEVGQRINVRV